MDREGARFQITHPDPPKVKNFRPGGAPGAFNARMPGEGFPAARGAEGKARRTFQSVGEPPRFCEEPGAARTWQSASQGSGQPPPSTPRPASWCAAPESCFHARHSGGREGGPEAPRRPLRAGSPGTGLSGLCKMITACSMGVMQKAVMAAKFQAWLDAGAMACRPNFEACPRQGTPGWRTARRGILAGAPSR